MQNEDIRVYDCIVWSLVLKYVRSAESAWEIFWLSPEEGRARVILNQDD